VLVLVLMFVLEEAEGSGVIGAVPLVETGMVTEVTDEVVEVAACGALLAKPIGTG
jgi:hypothetical protein